MRQLLLILLVTIPFTGFAQNDLRGSVGLRSKIGWDLGFYGGGEVSFQKNQKGLRRWELDLGFAGSSSWNGFQLTWLQQWKIIQKGRFNFYVGTGPTGTYVNQLNDDNLYILGLAGNTGIDFTFGFPIQIAFDWRPTWDIITNFGNVVGYDMGFAIRFGF